MDHTNWVWHNLGFMTETRCVCMSAFCFERRSAVTGDLIPHAVGRKWRVFCVCVCCYHLGKSLFCHVICTPPPQHWWAYELWWDKMQRKIILTCLCVFALQWKQITCSLADTSGLSWYSQKLQNYKKKKNCWRWHCFVTSMSADDYLICNDTISKGFGRQTLDKSQKLSYRTL